MNCPFCSGMAHKVIDKRSVNGTGEIRRRRECLKCSKRFTTYERITTIQLTVIKKDGRRELFSEEKLKAGMAKALEKRPSFDKADDLVDKVVRKIRQKGVQEIQSKIIGKLVLTELKKNDQVAYLRFASVYRQFGALDDFAKELENIN